MTPAAPSEAASREIAPTSETDLAVTCEAPPAPRTSARPALVVMRKRAEFVAASKARRSSRTGLNLQGRRRSADEPAEGIRVGFTCSKKVGNAVARNRAKRRLRAAAAEVLPEIGRVGWDYVLIGRPESTAARPWLDLLGDLRSAIAAVHEDRQGSPRR